MQESREQVRAFYEGAAQAEWKRLDGYAPEFEINLRMMERYLRPGDRVLDIGGGPGRYALALARRGCAVTLVDLSSANAELAAAKAAEAGLPITAMQGDALELDALHLGEFDHVLLMGPLYHLLEEEERKEAVRQALSRLKPGWTLFAAFISQSANLIDLLRGYPAEILRGAPEEEAWLQSLLEGRAYAGGGFTQVYFEQVKDVLPFFAQFPLETLHFLSSEGILAPFRHSLESQPQEVRERWLDIAFRLCEREEFLSYGEHLLYIGRLTAPFPAGETPGRSCLLTLR